MVCFGQWDLKVLLINNHLSPLVAEIIKILNSHISLIYVYHLLRYERSGIITEYSVAISRFFIFLPIRFVTL